MLPDIYMYVHSYEKHHAILFIERTNWQKHTVNKIYSENILLHGNYGSTRKWKGRNWRVLRAVPKVRWPLCWMQLLQVNCGLEMKLTELVQQLIQQHQGQIGPSLQELAGIQSRRLHQKL